MSRSILAALGLTCAAYSAAVTGAAEEHTSHPPFAATEAQQNLVVEEGVASLDGRFSHHGSATFFSTKIRDEGPVELRVSVDGFAFDAIWEPEGPTLHLDGHGAALGPGERLGLQKLSRRLQTEWRPYTGFPSLQRHLIFRLILMLSEAPVGMELGRRALRLPALPEHLQPAAAAGVPRSVGKRRARLPADLEGECQEVYDDDGVILLPCGPFEGEAWHDACDLFGLFDLHGFLSVNEIIGCDEAQECLGYCGGGCDGDGTGVYSQDCAEHDSCCRAHGRCFYPGDNYCGDEYWEAADDFFFPDPNCFNCLDGGAAPTVRTLTADQIARNTARLRMAVNPNDAHTETWFLWDDDQTVDAWETPRIAVGDGSDEIEWSYTLENLDCESTYYFEAHAENRIDDALGTILSFRTTACDGGDSPPSVTTMEADQLEEASARLNLAVDPNGENTEVWFAWDDDAFVDAEETPKAAVGDGTDELDWSYTLGGLACETPYWFEAHAKSNQGETVGNILPLETDDCSGGGGEDQIELVENGDFEDGDGVWWDADPDFYIDDKGDYQFSGEIYAYLSTPGREGGDNLKGDIVSDYFTIPENTVRALFSFQLSIRSDESDGDPDDLLTVMLEDEEGDQDDVMSLSELDDSRPGDDYVLASVFLEEHLSGDRVRIVFDGRTDGNGRPTIFRIDDVSLLATLGEGGPPDVATDPPDEITDSSIRLNLTVEPNGLPTDAWFTWGEDSNMDEETDPVDVGSGTGSVSVSRTISGLECDQRYYHQAHAKNSADDDIGSLRIVTTAACPPEPPDADTNEVDAITQVSAQLHGDVHPHDLDSEAWFEWGLTEDLGKSTPRQGVGDGDDEVDFAASITPLACGTFYYYEAYAENSAGEDEGGVDTFQTLACDLPPVDVPTARDDEYDTAAGSMLEVAPPGVLANDSDPEGDPLSAVLVQGPSHGTVALATDGSFFYSPEEGFAGVDSFGYTASDGPHVSNTATVTIAVRGGEAKLPPLIDLNVAPGTEVVPVTRLSGAGAGHSIGKEIATGDFNGDGLGDIVIGAEDAEPGGIPGRGAAYVLFGRATLREETELDFATLGQGMTEILGDGEDQDLGTCIAGGDVNGDGLDDLIIGADAADVEADEEAGIVFVIYGQGNFPQTIDLGTDPGGVVRILGDNEDDFMGRACGSGDFNGDGLADVIVASPSVDIDGASDVGKVHVVYGSRSLLGAIQLDEGTPGTVTVYGGGHNEDAGGAVSSGDLDGDGYDELIIGADSADVGDKNSAGKIYVLFGGDLPALVDLRTGPSEVLTLLGAESALLGSYLGGKADLDGDGYDDLLAGANGLDHGCSNCGGVFVVYGTPSLRSLGTLDLDVTAGTEPTLVTRIYGEEDGDNLAPVATGDLSGDGAAELVVAARSASPLGAGSEGIAYIIYGSTELRGIRELQLLTAEGITEVWGDDQDDALGTDLALADMNGDGRPDLVLGAPGSSPQGRQTAGEVFVIYRDEDPGSDNEAPIASPDVYSVEQGALLAIGPPGVLGNDSDPEGDALAARLESPPALGTLDLHADGSFTYTSAPSATGIDTFSYVASDGLQDSPVAVVRVEIIEVPACEETVTVSDHIVTETEAYAASDSITLGPNLIVSPQGHLYVETPGRVRFAPGFSVERGGRLTVKVSADACVQSPRK